MKTVLNIICILIILSCFFSCAKKATISPMEDGGFYVEMSNNMAVNIKVEDYEIEASTKKDVPDVKIEQESILRTIFGPALAILPFVD